MSDQRDPHLITRQRQKQRRDAKLAAERARRMRARRNRFPLLDAGLARLGHR